MLWVACVHVPGSLIVDSCHQVPLSLAPENRWSATGKPEPDALMPPPNGFGFGTWGTGDGGGDK